MVIHGNTHTHMTSHADTICFMNIMENIQLKHKASDKSKHNDAGASGGKLPLLFQRLSDRTKVTWTKNWHSLRQQADTCAALQQTTQRFLLLHSAIIFALSVKHGLLLALTSRYHTVKHGQC